MVAQGGDTCVLIVTLPHYEHDDAKSAVCFAAETCGLLPVLWCSVNFRATSEPLRKLKKRHLPSVGG